jgi:hypothetical protein
MADFMWRPCERDEGCQYGAARGSHGARSHYHNGSIAAAGLFGGDARWCQGADIRTFSVKETAGSSANSGEMLPPGRFLVDELG